MTAVSPAQVASHPFTRGMPADHVARLAGIASEVATPACCRLFEEGGTAQSLWLLVSGLVALDLRVPGLPALIVETIAGGEVIGLSWITPPREWQYGAEAVTDLRALRLDTVALMRLCDDDPALGYLVTSRRWWSRRTGCTRPGSGSLTCTRRRASGRA